MQLIETPPINEILLILAQIFHTKTAHSYLCIGNK